MNRDAFEKSILAFIDGTLNESDRQAFEFCIEQDSECSSLFAEYQEILALEQQLRDEAPELHPSFSAKVLDRIDSDTGFFKGTFMEFVRNRRALAVIASCACLAIGLNLMIQNEAIVFSKKAAVEQVQRADSQKSRRGYPTEYNDVRLPGAIEVPSILNRIATATTDLLKSKPLSESTDSAADADPAGSIARNEIVPAPRAKNEPLQSADGASLQKKGSQRVSALESRERKSRQSARKPVAPTHSVEERVKIEAESAYGATSDAPLMIDENAPGFSKEKFTPSAAGDVSQRWEENKRVAVANEPLSTFSIDVDTGSYTYARRFLQQGSVPPADSVRIEEFLNYFNYDYQEPATEPFALTSEIAPSPLEQDRLLLRLGIKARSATSDKPWNLVFLIDVSGSMNAPDKLGLVQSALAELVTNMRSQDRVAIVTYAGQSGILLNSTDVQNRSDIVRAINALTAGGSTHGSAGIETAYSVARSGFIKNGVNRVVLLTDGDFNVGTTSHDALISLIEAKRQEGITLTTVGVGSGNYHESLMEQLANKGNGNYFYLDSEQEAKKIFSKQLAGTMEVVAKDVKLQIEFNPAVVAQYRLIGYDNRKLRTEDFNNDAIDAGEIGAGHTVTALYELVLVNSKLAQDLNPALRYNADTQQPKKETVTTEEFAFLKIRYKEPEAATSKLKTFPLQVDSIQDEVSKTSNDFRFAAAVGYLGHKLRHSSYAGDYSYAAIKELAQSAIGQDIEGYRKEFITLIPK